MKEIVGIIIIVIAVCITSCIIETHLEETSSELLEKLANLKQMIKDTKTSNYSNNNNLKEESKKVINKWEETNEIWSIIIIHQELDNIKLSVLEVNAAIETGEYEDALEEIDKTIFLVRHIKEKEEFKLKNLF